MKKKFDKSFRFGVNITKKEGDLDGEFYVEGYASTADLDRQGDIISIEALEGASQDLDGKTAFYGHNYDLGNAVGLVASTSVDDIGLKVKIYVSKWAKELRTKLKEGIINSFSIGGQIIEDRTITKEEAIKQGYLNANEEILFDDINIVEKLRLFEVSFVGVPANAHAQVTLAKALLKAYNKKQENIKKIEDKSEETEETKEKTEEDMKKQDELLEKETYYECSSCDWSGESDELKDQSCPECGADVGEISYEDKEESKEEEVKEEKSEETDKKEEKEEETKEETEEKEEKSEEKLEEKEAEVEEKQEDSEEKEEKQEDSEEKKELEEKEAETTSLQKEIGELKESNKAISKDLKELKDAFSEVKEIAKEYLEKVEVIKVKAQKKSIIKDVDKKPKKKKKEIDPDEDFLKFIQED